MANYFEKLKDPRWQKKRLEVFERDGWRCQCCYNDSNTLTVHHKFYERDIEPWDYPIEALKTLCIDCHEKEYNDRDSVEKKLLRVLKKSDFLSDEILEIAEGFANLKIVGHPTPTAILINWILSNHELMEKLNETHNEELSKEYFKERINGKA